MDTLINVVLKKIALQKVALRQAQRDKGKRT